MRTLIGTTSFLLALVCGAAVAKADTCNAVSNNLVSNCSFETGDFSHWTASSSDPNYEGVEGADPYDFQAPYNGSNQAYLAGLTNPVSLSQTLATTAGVLYNIQFALANTTSPTTGYTNSFSALFGTNSIFSESAVLAGSYTLYSFSALATGTSTNLIFNGRNDGGDFVLDSVSVEAASGFPAPTVTPEPGSMVLLSTGMLGLIGAARRRLSA